MKIATPANMIILNEKNQVLLVKRAEKEDNFRGSWSIPGGGVEQNETYEDALHREILEELNCQIDNLAYFKSYYYVLSAELHVRAMYFYGTITGQIKLNKENSKYYWFDFDELKKLKLAYNQSQIINEFLKDYTSNKF
jgi:8-oxo-dGTP diphosphatase